VVELEAVGALVVLAAEPGLEQVLETAQEQVLEQVRVQATVMVMATVTAQEEEVC
jgi:hypothetical protein